MSLDYTHTLPSNGDEGDAFEHYNCHLCAYSEAWWDAQERGHTPQSCNVACRAMAGEEVAEIVCAEVPGAWPFGRAWQCTVMIPWRIPIPPESEREEDAT